EENHQLMVAELAAHNHNRNAAGVAEWVLRNTSGGSKYMPSTSVYTQSLETQTGSVGSNAPHNNMPPSLVLNYIIKA
ncbi:MAG: phage tail protein, partial [Anaerolineae bacterium]|nr:phage tail protein [Anaerolineae bacterium]